MSSSLHTEVILQAPARDAIADAAWHALVWLAIANAVGVLIAVLLLFPGLNQYLGEWTYGRWMMVHMNLELYGWTALPMVGFLFRVYSADRGPSAKWCKPILWTWSAALAIGALSWLTGHSSGKLFLDWSGYARDFFFVALLALWLLIVTALVLSRTRGKNSRAAFAGKIAGIAVLAAVPFVIYIASGAAGYPAVNPDSGGPTGASQLESSLAIVLILLMLPFGLSQWRHRKSRIVSFSWGLLIAEGLMCAALGRGDVSHHRPSQFIGLAGMLFWLPVIPKYYAAFAWNANTRLWRVAFQCWWAALVVTGWIFFLPGVLDHFKFTDGLVGHSFVAMAGFTSSLVIFAMVQMLGEDGWIFNRRRSFWLWHASVVVYVLLMTIAGWREGFDPTFTIVPGATREILYSLRLVSGVLMLLASVDWLVDCRRSHRELAPAAVELVVQEAR